MTATEPENTPNILSPEVRATLLRSFQGKDRAAARAKVEAYLAQPAIAAYVAHLNRTHTEAPAYWRTTNCYTHAIGLTVEQFDRLDTARDPQLEGSRCLNPGTIGGLRFLTQVRYRRLGKRNNVHTFKLLKALQDEMRQQLAESRAQLASNKAATPAAPTGTELRLALLADGLTETHISQPVPAGKRRVFICTHGRDYHAFREETEPLTVQNPDGSRKTITPWSHKNGVGGEVSIFGPDGELITDPQAAVGHRTTAVGFFLREDKLVLNGTSFLVSVAPQHREELRAGAQRIVATAIQEITKHERIAGIVLGKHREYQQVVRYFGLQHGLEINCPTVPKPTPTAAPTPPMPPMAKAKAKRPTKIPRAKPKRQPKSE